MTKDGLVNLLIRSGALRQPAHIEAFKAVDRADFAGSSNLKHFYEDIPLPIGHGQTISQPTTVAFMLHLLDPKPNKRILDIGAGSGWTTALLAYLVGPSGEVIGLERIPELVAIANRNLASYSYSWASVKLASHILGLPSSGPFDRILVSAAATELPKELTEQLKLGGRLVLPIKNSIWLFDKLPNGKIKSKEYPGFVFVPLIKE